jgi:hypothetical protein
MSAPEGKTDVPREPGHFRFWPRTGILKGMLRSITSPGLVNGAVVGKGREVNIEFLIAPSAKKQIEWLVDELKRRNGKADVIPAVMWIDALP